MVRALISVRSDEPMSYEVFEISTGNNICELQNSQQCRLFQQADKGSGTSPGGAPSTNEETVSNESAIASLLSNMQCASIASPLSRSKLWKLR